MKHLLIVILLFSSLQMFAASRYWVGGHPTNNNWNQTGSGTTNWSATTGGAAGASVPGASDDVIFDGAGTGNSTSTVSATITVLSFTITSGYTSTITHNSVLTVAGNVTLNTSYTIAGTSGLTISATSTITSGGKTWPNNVIFSGGFTRTLSGNWIVGGLLTFSTGTHVLNATTAETLSCVGFGGTAPTSGTAKLILTGGTWNCSGTISNNIDIQGNITLGGSMSIGGGCTLTYISGTITPANTLTITGSCTLNTNGMSWGNISLTGTGTMTINSLWTVTGTLSNTSTFNYTFAGSFGFSIATFSISNISSSTFTFNDGVTYTITTAFNAFNSRTGSILTFTSDHGTNKANITLSPNATCNVLANFTRIDASGGRPIRSFNGTITSCTNVYAFNDLRTIVN